MDVTKAEQVEQGVREIRRLGMGLDGLVNNAATIDVWPLVELRDEELKRSLEVNVFGAHRVVREAVQMLVASKGRIVNVSSLEGLVTTRFAGPYEMSKFALEAYSDNLRRELESYGVGVVLVEPGGFRTSYARTTAKVVERRSRARSPSLMKKEAQEIAKGWQDEVEDVDRRAEPSLVVAAVHDALFSARPKNRYVVTAREGEFRWVMDELVSKLIEVNRGSNHGLRKADIHALVDAKWTGAT